MVSLLASTKRCIHRSQAQYNKHARNKRSFDLAERRFRPTFCPNLPISRNPQTPCSRKGSLRPGLVRPLVISS